MDTVTERRPSRNEAAFDLAKIGINLYVVGLFVTFIYYTQLQILSVDLLKPSAIIIGIYVWMLAELLPKLIIWAILRPNLSDKKERVVDLIFIALLLTTHVWMQVFFNGWSGVAVFFALITVAGCYIFFSRSVELCENHVSFKPSLQKRAGFIAVYAVIFSLSIYPKLPQYLGGGQPTEVKVYPKDRQVMLSQFSSQEYDADSCITATLLYEGVEDYYFMDRISEQNTGVIVQYRIHKVKKDEIKKIIYRRPFWINFK